MATPSFPSRAGSPPIPLWASGRFVLRVHGVSSNWQKVSEIRRPYALIGRLPGSDIQIDDRALSARHVYLHLTTRGLFAVDLASRSGTWIGPQGRAAGWLQPGDSLEVAGRKIDVLDIQIQNPEPLTNPSLDDPLSESPNPRLTHITLYPGQGPQAPLALNSELVFLGRSAACGVQVDEPSAARIQCVLVRSPLAAYVVDLLGRTSWINGRPLRNAQPLHDGDILTIGSSRFECRISPPDTSPPKPTQTSTPNQTSTTPQVPAPLETPASEVLSHLEPPPLPPGLVPPEAQTQVLAWMMGVLQATQGEILRRQSEFQNDVVDALRQIQDDNKAALDKHLQTVETLNQQLSSLRDEVRRRFGPSAPPSRPEPPRAPPLRINTKPPTPADDPEAAAAWILNRVSQIDQENRTSWRDLLGRIHRRNPK